MDLTAFTISKMIAFLLVLARTSGVFIASPVFSSRNIAIPAKICISVALSIIFVPMVKPVSEDIGTLVLVSMVAKEITVGYMMGFLASLTIAAIRIAGTYIDLSAGFGFAQMVDPMSQEQNSVMGQLLNLVATLMFLVTKAHHLVIQGLADSFTVMPLGNLTVNPELTGNFFAVFGTIFLAALKIAAPILGVIFLTDLSLGILSRTVPQLNIINVGFSVKMVVCLVTVMILMPIAIGIMADLFGGIRKDFTVLVKLLNNAAGG